MNPGACRVLSGIILTVIVLEGLSWLLVARAFYGLYAGANAPIGSVVWSDLALASLHFAVAFLYFTNHWNARKWFAALAFIALVVGIWFLSAGWPPPLVNWSLRGLMRGDIVEIGALGSLGYLALGILGLADAICQRRAGKPWERA